ncbi:DUF3604 domain-containing protein [Paenibacillus chondroitinus]|uniref:DUF3604 domain-containing protein n=1 Tax=Paenibacillus chondroitinus TaxID=59842 RepID=A0ABU6DDL6_9BACL|nr:MULTISPECIES: DUF3604 domain-containing protein [Paenibacillus]MCY9662965.1 DUF3604 domain-containing protein [Paenibacillus anseongense]MEB4795586.1 DUF3604 domain-containing protein [Paenibacillus chondroitinus]
MNWSDREMKLFWGDLHNHCGITYGFGGLENALSVAKEQLDFCAIIAHAMWPDMPERTEGLEFLVDFHLKGFAKLRGNWEHVRETVKTWNVPHEFVTFQGYEIHSSEFGDHHVLSTSDELPLIEAGSPSELVAALAPLPVIAVPHHVSYTPGYRGANWEAFSESISPVVEVYSKHGCSMSDSSAYPCLHTMGPRDSRNTVVSAIRSGRKFGFAGSTDHHAGYPGSYGDGRVAVLATEKTRDAIWEALLARRTYAITGDKIACSFTVNGAIFGSEVKVDGRRELKLDVTGCDFIDKVSVYKNGVLWKVVNAQHAGLQQLPEPQTQGKYKVRVEMGWGDSQTGYVWQGNARLDKGQIVSLETCFRGQSVLAPTPEMRDNPDINLLGNKLIAWSEQKAEWTCTTFKNVSTRHPQTAALIFEIEGDTSSQLSIEVNGQIFTYTIGELLEGSRSAHMLPHSSEAILVHRAVPEHAYSFRGEWHDDEKERDCDAYHVEIRQTNEQYAWITPVFVIS